MHPLFHPLYVDYCTYFNGNQDYFECHEVLEEYWKEIAPGDKNHPLVGYIQLATALYHWRRNNKSGATKQLSNAYKIFVSNSDSIFFEFIDYKDLCKHCLACISAIEQDLPFKVFHIKLTNAEFENLVNKRIQDLPMESFDFLLNKHMLRDRSDILKARDLKRESKRKS